MDSRDLDLYYVSFINSAKETIALLKLNLKEDTDINLLHLLFHNLKGQAYFMNINDLASKCLEAESIIRKLLDNKQIIRESDLQSLKIFVKDIEFKLKKYEDTNRRRRQFFPKFLFDQA